MIDAVKNALLSVWTNKVRSVLNIVGVVIGVASVTLLVGLGEGLKQDVSGMIQDFGTNLIAVTGGKLDAKGGSQATNPANFINGDIITKNDLAALQGLENLEYITPTNLVSGSLKYGEKTAAPTIFGTYPTITKSLQVLKLDKGTMFTSGSNENVIVLGSSPAEELFGDTNPVGKMVMLGKEEFKVIGTFAKAKSGSYVGSEFDVMSVVPYDTATRIKGGEPKIFRIFSRAKEESDVKAVKKEVRQVLLDNHNGEEDFTVLTADDMLDLFDTFLTLATTMVSAIAAISLVVGGIGIMNIMLVTVTERTREIGLRKAVGATKGAILTQFLVEAVVVTFIGSLIGLGIAFIGTLAVAANTELNPIITPEIIILAVGISVVIGIIFGLWPAVRAAQKDPIEALRYE